jgi:hydrogenase maturation protease
MILGIGNILNRDEGLGVHAVHCIQAESSENGGIEIKDGGTLGLNLLPLIEECSHLLIIDAIDAGKIAGTVIELRGNDIPMFAQVKLSDHQTTLRDVLGYAKMRGKLPHELVLLGVQPEDTSLGIGLGDAVEKATERLVARAKEIIKTWHG